LEAELLTVSKLVLVDFELDSGIWYACGFGGVETVFRVIAAFGLTRLIYFLL
jgi:hypothetical protein